MWEDHITMKVGDWLVGTRCDTLGTGAAARAALSEYLVERNEPAPPAFSLRAAGPSGRRRERATLSRGTTPIAKADSVGPLIEALRDTLRGLERSPATARPAPTDPMMLPLRLFARDAAAVLVNVGQPTLVDDRWLLDRGIREVHCWQPLADPVSRRIVDPGLFSVVGIVSVTSSEGADAVSDLWSFADHRRNEWLEWLLAMKADGRIIEVANKPVAARTAVAALLERAA